MVGNLRNLAIGLVVFLAFAASAAPVGNVPYAALPNCPDTGGNHVNINSSTGAISCGNSGSATTPASVLAASSVAILSTYGSVP